MSRLAFAERRASPKRTIGSAAIDLFRQAHEANLKKAQPLAARMRPRSLDEFAGQEHFIGEGKLLRRMLQADRLGSLIFYGPPGTGKTALAHVIAHQATDQSRRRRACQQDRADGLGDAGEGRALQGTGRARGLKEITPDIRRDAMVGEDEQHVMQSRSIRRSGQPTWATASSNACF